MHRMSRLTLFLAAALAAAPSAAWAQPGAGAQPSRPVDECGKPATPRPRRGTATPPASGGAPAAQPPHVLGTPAGGAAGSSPSPGTAEPASSGTSGAQTPPQASGMAEGMSSAAVAGATGGQVPQGSAYAYAGSTCTTMAAGSAGASTAPAIDPRAARRNRDALRLGLSESGDRRRLGPAASVSVPTAFGVDAGEVFMGVAYQGRTRYTEDDDAAAVLGFGIGTRRVVALEAAFTSYSTIRSYPFETGGVSLKLHRAFPRQTSLAVGYENALSWGGSDGDGSLYGAVTRLVNLREDPEAPFNTAVFTVGLGNGRFRFEKDDAAEKETLNLFAAAGARVTPQVSLVADWTGQDLNAAASLTPLRHIPVVVTVGLADLTGSAGDGARFILSLGYGLAFRQPF
ncbi:hypothetical protein [Longimicrobium sp.]|uniref:hypothetical protein n=1 Tax=Longimicrobium sp. TaxID=2029185 RepID=UPI003B3BB8A4